MDSKLFYISLSLSFVYFMYVAVVRARGYRRLIGHQKKDSILFPSLSLSFVYVLKYVAVVRVRIPLRLL